jgi:hypothetical protein
MAVSLGILKPEWTVKYGAVFLIFFNSGLTLRSPSSGTCCHSRLYVDAGTSRHDATGERARLNNQHLIIAAQRVWILVFWL